MTEIIEIACTVDWETDKALLINDGTQKEWLPRSLLEDHTEDKKTGKITSVWVPYWWAKKNGFI